MYDFDLLLQKDLGDVMEEIDTDKSGGIDFEEFLNFMTTERSSRKNSATEYSEIFDFMDVDKNGFISAEDLKEVRIREWERKMDEFPENFRRGGGVISDPKNFIAIFFA